MLKVTVGQHSDKGRKAVNQDFHGACLPTSVLLSSKGVAIALADGISSSDVSQIASEAAVTGFLEDYYCTSEAWSVKKSAERVLIAINSWLHAQTQQSQYRFEKDRGYVCTLSAMVIKASTAHLFHVGDTRIYRLRDKSLEQLTNDHRVWLSSEQSYLGRALGVNPQLEIDYRTEQLETGDLFLFACDGVYEHCKAPLLVDTLQRHADDLEQAAKAIVALAYEHGSTDNLTALIVQIDELPQQLAVEAKRRGADLPFAPILQPRAVFEGYKIVRELQGNSRSHIYLAEDQQTQALVVIKAPSIDLQSDPAHLERFLMEEWVARRINNAHVLKPYLPTRKRHHQYIVMEFVDGQTLSQWLVDNPRPTVQAVRNIIEQIAKGLRAFHRQEMLHQDIRPNNIMIDATGTVKIIDFGSTRVAGIQEAASKVDPEQILGTAQYTAPEYFLGEAGTARSDIFSLGVIAYQMLSGRLPYGTQVAKSRTQAAQRKLTYVSVLADDREIPLWMDGALRKAVHPNPNNRYEDVSEFVYDLSHPNRAFLDGGRPPLIERNPLLFWKGVACALLLLVLVLLFVKT